MDHKPAVDPEFISIGAVPDLVDGFYESVRSSVDNAAGSIVPPPVLYRDSVVVSDSDVCSNTVVELRDVNIDASAARSDSNDVVTQSSSPSDRKFVAMCFSLIFV